MKRLLFTCLWLLVFQTHAQYVVEMISEFNFQTPVHPDKISYRGLCVVSNEVVWLSGSKGTFAKSTDGGKHFTVSQVTNYTHADFRDIEAFDANNAIMISSGTPALILKTTDGGESWIEVYKQTDSAYFFDAVSFFDKQHGLVIGDPIDGFFVILETTNGGQSWQQWDKHKTYLAKPGESLFAASGSCMGTFNNSTITIVTGGAACRLLTATINKNEVKWRELNLPMIHGNEASGAFSVAKNKNQTMVVGGNYANDKLDSATYCLWHKNQIKKTNSKVGYGSSVVGLSSNKWLSCGTGGVSIYHNEQWHKISNTGFNVVATSKNKNLTILAGSKGKVAILK